MQLTRQRLEELSLETGIPPDQLIEIGGAILANLLRRSETRKSMSSNISESDKDKDISLESNELNIDKISQQPQYSELEIRKEDNRHKIELMKARTEVFIKGLAGLLVIITSIWSLITLGNRESPQEAKALAQTFFGGVIGTAAGYIFGSSTTSRDSNNDK